MSVHFDNQSYYYSGQGQVFLGGRQANGKPGKLLAIGNVSDLKISVETTVVEHKEAQTGQRGIDLRLQTETKASLSMTMESFVATNLAQALRGTNTARTASSVTGEAISLYPGGVTGLGHINVSAVAIKQNAGATTLTAYVDDVTPYDYKVNTDAGSILVNDGSSLAWANLGVAASAIAVGATTTVTVSSAANAAVGGTIYVRGFAGADAADINDQHFTITAVTATTITFAVDTTGDTITVTGSKLVWDGVAGTADYGWTDQNLIDALNVGITDIYMRFEGLNTAQSNQPVVVEVFRFSTDPLKELALISDTVQQFVLEGSVLLDSLQTTGSKYFSVKTLS